MSEKVTYVINVEGNAEEKFRKAGIEFKKFDNSIGGSSKNFMGMKTSALAGAAAVTALGIAAKKTINQFAEFEKIKAILTNTFSSKFIAESEFKRLQDFALNTPFEFKKLAASYTKLVNRGFKPTNKELRQLGDLAAVTGKDFDQLAEAVLDAQQGEFERLKEFGIKARKEGDLVKLTFKGVTKEVENTEDAIRNAIIGMGGMQGVAGAMAVMESTIQGRESALGDKWDAALSNIGEKLSGVYGTLLDIAGYGLDLVNYFLGKDINQQISEYVGKLDGYFKTFTGLSGQEQANFMGVLQQQFGGEFTAYAKAAKLEKTNILDYFDKNGQILSEFSTVFESFVKEAKVSGAYKLKSEHLQNVEQAKATALSKYNMAEADLRSLGLNPVDVKQSTYWSLLGSNKGAELIVEALGIGPEKNAVEKYFKAQHEFWDNEAELKQLKKESLTKTSLTDEYLKQLNLIGTVDKNTSAAGTAAGTGTVTNLANAAPRTFNVSIDNLVKIDEQNVMTGEDTQQFIQMLTNALNSALVSIAIQAAQG